jgi:hypothetical protein
VLILRGYSVMREVDQRLLTFRLSVIVTALVILLVYVAQQRYPFIRDRIYTAITVIANGYFDGIPVIEPLGKRSSQWPARRLTRRELQKTAALRNFLTELRVCKKHSRTFSMIFLAMIVAGAVLGYNLRIFSIIVPMFLAAVLTAILEFSQSYVHVLVDAVFLILALQIGYLTGSVIANVAIRLAPLHSRRRKLFAMGRYQTYR